MNIFQKLILSTLFFLLGVLPSVFAQNSSSPIKSQSKGVNMIDCNSYGAIKYNGHTIDEFNTTKGDLSDLKQLVGPPSSVNTENSIIGEVAYIFSDSGNRVTFWESELKRIDITTNDWPVTIQGNDISIGTSFSSLKQNFGSDLKILTGAFNNPEADYAVGF